MKTIIFDPQTPDKPSISHLKRSNDTIILRDLEDHLLSVATLARTNANKFDSGDWAYLSGLLHDLGKYQTQFQDRIRVEHNLIQSLKRHTKKPHSNAGALFSINKFKETNKESFGKILAYLIAGHHGGIPNWYSNDAGNTSLGYRLENAETELQESLKNLSIESPIWKIVEPQIPIFGGFNGLALWMRMLFSCLVDADSLDTEQFMNQEKAEVRKTIQSDFEEIQKVFDLYIDQLQKWSLDTEINRIRKNILIRCKQQGTSQQGFYSLTVPTGGGKTLASMAFAISHLRAHHLDRIIYVIPYTSIIEQTASVFKKIWGNDIVIEHHSNLDPDEESFSSNLATENWDAPIIVTTNVRFFESLFSSKRKGCRRLHNITRSVVVFDEAQQIPRDFLGPILNSIQLLRDYYKVSFLFCTATQPALNSREDAHGRVTLKGLAGITEIVEEPENLYKNLKRVIIQLPEDYKIKSKWDEIAEKIAKEDNVLCIVNARNDCKQLYEMVKQLCPKDWVVHLSASMCGEHRSKVIETIKNKLADSPNHQSIKVISTQLVEAGVDIDFPVVYRAIAGLDSIAQAAGRCNREGKLKGLGRVVVFVPESEPPIGHIRQGTDTAKELLQSNQVTAESLLSPETSQRYFDYFYNKGGFDIYNINKIQTENASKIEIPFSTINEKFKLIEDEGISIIVPYEDNDSDKSNVYSLLENLSNQSENARKVYRKMQRYTVSVPVWVYEQLMKKNAIKVEHDLNILLKGYYSMETGVTTDLELEPSNLIS